MKVSKTLIEAEFNSLKGYKLVKKVDNAHLWRKK